MVKLLLFCFRVTNLLGELVFSHVRVVKIWKISNYSWNYWLENWKKTTKCWSRIMFIRDFFIEMKYYTIQSIWKEIRKLNFVIIDVDLALKVACVADIKLFFMDWIWYNFIVLIK